MHLGNGASEPAATALGGAGGANEQGGEAVDVHSSGVMLGGACRAKGMTEEERKVALEQVLTAMSAAVPATLPLLFIFCLLLSLRVLLLLLLLLLRPSPRVLLLTMMMMIMMMTTTMITTMTMMTMICLGKYVP